MMRYVYTLWNVTNPDHAYPVGSYTGWDDRDGSVEEARQLADGHKAALGREFPDQRYALGVERYGVLPREASE